MKIAKMESINISKKQIIYISPEYGYDENINNYAGGLGILAGDYLKEASDKNLPIIAVGLFYKEGYFTQSFDINFDQVSEKSNLDYDAKSYEILKENGSTKIFEIKLGIGIIKFKVIKTKIKNVDLYLIDSNVEDNYLFTDTTNMLYTPSRKQRLLQEILLGQGAIMLLEYLKIQIEVLHINEGHAAFALLERINQLADINNDFELSIKTIKKTNFFTTHTPIIHGNEEFDIELIKEVLTASSLLRYLSINKFCELGITPDNKSFSMTVLAIKLSEKFNSVSKLHQKVATKMWKVIDENIKFENVTNGIYVDDWLAPEIETAIKGNDNQSENLINAKKSLKKRIIIKLNQNNFYNKSESLIELYKNTNIGDNSFIIGFARRFAPYKRANLLFSDIKYLKKFFINNPQVVLIISGKAHPADVDGKKIIKDILTQIRDNNLNNNIIFIENYNIKIAKSIIWASDIWLNNPIRGLEACGTSGMKAAINASINYSVLDGWWDEAYSDSIGFKIANRRINKLPDNEIAKIILDELENKIIPMSANTIQWSKLIMKSTKTIMQRFTTERMLADYLKIYDSLLSNRNL